MSEIDTERAARFAAAFPARTPEMVAKHRERAVQELAHHRCSTDLTDGFCQPDEGKCTRPDHRNCMWQAEHLVRAIEGRGCTVVWAFDRSMTPEVPPMTAEQCAEISRRST